MSVEEYIVGAPIASQQRLLEMYAFLQEVLPMCEPTIAYKMPAFKYNKRIVVYFAGYEKHIGYYPTNEGIVAFESVLKDYKYSKGTVQFPHDKPLPLALIREIALFRLKSVE